MLVTQANISRVLLNLFKRLIFVMFRDSSSPPPNVPAVNIHIFSLVHQLPLILTLTFVPLSYLFGLWHDMYIQLGRVYLRAFEDCIGLFIFSLLLLLFQNLY